MLRELWFTATVWMLSGYWTYKNKLRGSLYQLLEAPVIARLAKLDFQAWIYLFLTSCVSMNKFTNLSNSQCPHLQNDSQFHEFQYYIDSHISKWQRKPMNAWNSICFMETLYWELPMCTRHCAYHFINAHPYPLKITNSKKVYTCSALVF